MRLKNAIKLLFANFSSIYKVLLFRCIVFTVLTLICGILVIPNFEYFVEQSKISELITSAWGVIRSIFNSELDFGEMQSVFTSNFNHFNSYVRTNLSAVYVPILIIIGFYLLGAFISKLGDYAAAEVLNEHMSTLATRGFCVCLFKNLGTACLFSLIDMLFEILFAIIGTALSLVVIIFTIEYISLFAIFIAILIILCTNALRKTLFSDFMPRVVVDDEKVGKAFVGSLKKSKDKFGRIFSNYFSINMIMLYLNVSFALCTFFTGLIITLPMTIMIALCFKFVNYFTLNGKKFYLSYDEIVTPKTASADSELMTNIYD